MFCQNCGKEVVEGQAFCQECGHRLMEKTPAPVSTRSQTPWEDRETNGFFRGLYMTLKFVLTNPTAFFRQMPVTGGLTDPLLYALIVGTAGLSLHYFWSILLYNSIQGFLPPELTASAYDTTAVGSASSWSAIVMPLVFMIWLFVISGALHLFLMMVSGARKGFEATFRVVGYSISPFVCLAVPFCGMPVTAVWVMLLAVIGIKESHETTGGKAAFAVFFPFLFCCGLMIAAAVLFMGAVAASFGAMMHFP